MCTSPVGLVNTQQHSRNVKAWLAQQSEQDMLLLAQDDNIFMHHNHREGDGGGGGGGACAKFKERYNAHGYPDIYGAYDRNGRYRVSDIYYNTPPDDDDDDDTHANDSRSTSSNDDDGDSSSSSGEYPSDYFERAFAGGGAGIDDYMMHTGHNNNNNNNSNGGGYSQLQKFQQAVTDISAVLDRPVLQARDEGDDAIMQIAMIRAIMARFGGTGCVPPSHAAAATTTKRTPKKEPPLELQPAKKRPKLTTTTARPAYSTVLPPNTTDQIYMARVGETDCFNCMLCDPFKLKEIKLPAWNNHCVSQIHCMKRDNEAQQKNLYGS